MPTKTTSEMSGTPSSEQSSKRAGAENPGARDGEEANAQRTAAADLKQRALERWENEGGGPGIDSPATQPGDPTARAGTKHGRTA